MTRPSAERVEEIRERHRTSLAAAKDGLLYSDERERRDLLAEIDALRDERDAALGDVRTLILTTFPESPEEHLRFATTASAAEAIRDAHETLIAQPALLLAVAEAAVEECVEADRRAEERDAVTLWPGRGELLDLVERVTGRRA